MPGCTGSDTRGGLDASSCARVTEGGARNCCRTSPACNWGLGPKVTFPPMPDPPPGFITHIAVERIGGVGPSASR